ncbi:MAG: ATP-binding protein [Candidatus Nanopelagicales bacterium]
MTGIRSRLVDLAAEPQLRGLLVDNAWRGVRVQLVLRAALAAFVVLVVVLVPPARNAGTALAIALGYAVWAGALALVARARRLAFVRWIAVTLVVDVVVISVLCFVASGSDVTSWTTDVLVFGFFLLPVMAATQLRPWVSAVVVVPTVLAFFWTSWAARAANGDEPWSALVLSTVALAGVGVGCILLSRVQAGRVLDIGGLASDRASLLTEMVGVEERERRDLAETLHDGALQYLLAARQDLEDVGSDPEAVARLDHALREATGLLRATTTELHPAVLEQAGLPLAVRELARTVSSRGSVQVDVDDTGWPEGTRTAADALLLATARELLTNVVKHSGAAHAHVVLAVDGGEAVLDVSDDGRGADPALVEERAAQGHLGLVSRRVRIESAGGTLAVVRPPEGGTRVECRVPVR